MNKNANMDELLPRAIVAYTDNTSFPCLRWLRRGFRHCMTMVSAPPYWVMVDGLSNRTVVAAMTAEALAGFLMQLHQAGYRCQYIPLVPLPPVRIGLMPQTCVETAKRLLGIHNKFVLTPYQLYTHINKNILTTK